MARNKLGQITGKDPIKLKISKQLLKIADEVAIRVKPIIRDQLETSLRANIYASYEPATKSGKAVQEYNDTHAHQKAKPYHHTGLLARSVYCTIDGNMVKANVRKDMYSNGTSAAEVYNYLKFGTTNNPKSDFYSYDNGKSFSRYIAQKPHNFEAATRKEMKVFLKGLATDIELHPENYARSYKNHRI